MSISPDVAIEEAKLKVNRLEKALEAMVGSSGAEVDCLQRALAKAREAARERPLEVQIKECQEFTSWAEHRVAKLEEDVLAEGRARLSRLGQQTQVPPPVPTKSSGRVGANRSPHWCRSSMHSEPLPSPRRRGQVTPRPPQSSKEAFEVLMTRAAKRHVGRPVEEDVTPEDAQGLTVWLIDRHAICETP